QALTKLSFYTFEDISKLTSKSTFDLTNLGFGDKPVALFIAVPFYDRSKDSIVATMIGQIWSANSRMAASTKALKCKRKIIYHLNEIGNYPPIKDFDTMLSIGLGTNQIFNLFIQSYNQLDVSYGKKAGTIKDNCGTHIYIQTISK
ncbi:TraM recognition domain-containing protein, partial [Serratia marcescens]|uniref:TraM recognition domain-containing protein n=1 Tax=Serratia marcescens TaxID=615 RepID=UPI0011E82A7D